ncbi:HNH endonuclease [Streptomyces sp. NPDC058637]|uniref:HNH endonuclease n=1 Tax=Streptomyces sp. NPDC058637 TaxID=3346569 RepID=UPI00365C2E4E
MTLPSWRDEKFGTMKRAALWLVSVVGEGNVFTKEDVKNAFPGISQADRRVRDLRDYGWQIDTHREDGQLGQSEQRFVAQGQPVWVKATKDSSSITDTQRRKILASDGHRCRSCGITPGQAYAGSFETAQIDIARRKVKHGGSSRVELVAECNRCRVGGRGLEADLDDVLDGVSKLGGLQRQMLADWVAADEREFGAVELLWGDFRTLPAESRDKVRAALGLRPA